MLFLKFSCRQALGGSLICLAGLALPVEAAGQGISIGLSPEAASYRWADGLGVEDDALFLGGAAKLGFGRYVALRGSYRTASSLSVSFEDTDYRYLNGSAVEGNVMDVDVAAADLVLRLGRGPLVPILVSSGGVFSFRPDGRETSRQMFLGLGGGLGVRIGQAIDGQLVLQDVRFRVDRGLMASQVGEIAPPPDPSEQELWRNIHLSASLGARIGGRRSSAGAEDADRGFGGLYEGSTDNLFVPLELFAGMMRFHDDLGIGDRGQVGVRGGVDFGSYFGVRGTYWRGTATEFDRTEGIQSWSGEARFSVGSVTSAAPYLILGFGQIAFDDDFRNDENLALADQNSVIVGAGLRLPLWDRIRLNASIRDYVIASSSYDEVAQPTDLLHNPAVELGISYLVLGRNGSRPAIPVAPRPVALETEPGPAEPTITPSTDPVVDIPPTPATPRSDSIVAAGAAGPTTQGVTPDSARGYQSDRFISIPLPTEGELRIRYGPAGVVEVSQPSADETGAGTAAEEPEAVPAPVGGLPAQQIITVPGAPSPQVLTPQDLNALEDRIAARMDAVMARTAALPDDQDAEIRALRQQVGDLSELVREMMREPGAADAQLPSIEMSTPGMAGLRSSSAASSSPVGALHFSGVEGRIGTATVRDSRAGRSMAGEVSFGGIGPSALRPFVGIRASSVEVRTTFDESSVFGTVTNFGASIGAHYDFSPLNRVIPTASAMVTALGGGTSGDSRQDAELMGDLYDGFAVGPALGVGLAYPLDSTGRLLVTGRTERLWAGARSGWSIDAGLRYTPPRPVPAARISLAAPAPPAVAANSADALTGPSASIQPTTLNPSALVVLPAPDAERAALIRRLSALEEALADDAAARLEREREERQREMDVASAMEREASIRRELDEIAAGFPDLVSIVETGRGTEITLGGALFGVGDSELTDRARSALTRLSVILRGIEGTIFVEGHTDATGSAASNLVLSERRAVSVRNALLASGVDGGRVTVVASGASRPRADNSTAEGRTMNRRVEIAIPR